eukprot:3255073-Amphidinium_carterae.1
MELSRCLPKVGLQLAPRAHPWQEVAKLDFPARCTKRAGGSTLKPHLQNLHADLRIEEANKHPSLACPKGRREDKRSM